MRSFVVLAVVFSSLISCNCDGFHPRDIAIKGVVDEGSLRNEPRSFKSRTLRHITQIVVCLGSWDTSCALDEAEDAVADVNKSLWDEADKQALQSGRAEEDSKPSALMQSISSIISELTDLFKDGIAGLFRDAKENTDDDTEIEEEEEIKNKDTDDKENVKKSRGLEEARGKKKKKKKAIIKLLLLGAVVATKIKLLLKALAVHLQIKFLLIALAGLLINAARFYVELKKGHQPQKVIYYEHAQHQHHYEGGDEDWHGGWSRSYDEENKVPASEKAYSHQRPHGLTYSKVNEKPNYSWD